MLLNSSSKSASDRLDPVPMAQFVNKILKTEFKIVSTFWCLKQSFFRVNFVLKPVTQRSEINYHRNPKKIWPLAPPPPPLYKKRLALFPCSPSSLKSLTDQRMRERKKRITEFLCKESALCHTLIWWWVVLLLGY